MKVKYCMHRKAYIRYKNGFYIYTRIDRYYYNLTGLLSKSKVKLQLYPLLVRVWYKQTRCSKGAPKALYCFGVVSRYSSADPSAHLRRLPRRLRLRRLGCLENNTKAGGKSFRLVTKNIRGALKSYQQMQKRQLQYLR